MPDNRESTGGMLGLLGAGMVVCCGLPLLLGAGIAVSAAGLAAGSSILVVAGIALGVWAWRRRRHANRCDIADPEPSLADDDDAITPSAVSRRTP